MVLHTVPLQILQWTLPHFSVLCHQIVGRLVSSAVAVENLLLCTPRPERQGSE